MIKTIIIDDEQHCINTVLKLIKNYSAVFDILGCYKTVDDALVATRTLSPDLVFLDIEINDQTGFDYLEQIDKVDFQVVFTTAHNKYAVKAFKFSALHYLLKPIDVDDFDEVVKRITSGSTLKNLEENVSVLMHNLKTNNSEKRITINTSTDFRVLDVSDIMYCQADVNYTDIYTIDDEKITSAKTLKTYEDLLNDSNFYRVDQSFLVNLKYVKKYTRGKPAYAIMKNGAKIKVSLSKKEGFVKRLTGLSNI